jgi:hypothetical protein
MVPTQLPANRLCFELRCCLTVFVADSFTSGFGFGLDTDFDFGFADCSAAGVGAS